MRFPNTVTEAHQWWKNGDHPEDDSEMIPLQVEDGVVTPAHLTEGKVVKFSTDPSPTLHPPCGSAMANHGNLDGQPVCPGNWIATTKTGREVFAEDPMADAYVTERDGDTLTIQEPTEAEPKKIKVAYYADCRQHARRKFPTADERDTYAGTHTTETGHIVDTYEVQK